MKIWVSYINWKYDMYFFIFLSHCSENTITCHEKVMEKYKILRFLKVLLVDLWRAFL